MSAACSGACPICCAQARADLQLLNAPSSRDRQRLAMAVASLIDDFERRHPRMTSEDVRGALLDALAIEDERAFMRRCAS